MTGNCIDRPNANPNNFCYLFLTNTGNPELCNKNLFQKDTSVRSLSRPSNPPTTGPTNHQCGLCRSWGHKMASYSKEEPSPVKPGARMKRNPI